MAALVPGGVFLLEAYRPEQLQFGTGGPSSAESRPTLRDLQQELHGLTWLLAVGRQRFVHEGRGHHGPSAVVQAIARKPLAAG